MRPMGMTGFRRRNASVVAAGRFGPDMTPMVDIVMVILIFFMAGSAFIGPEWFLDVGMAKGAAPTAPEAPPPPLDLPQTRAVLRLSGGAGGAGGASGGVSGGVRVTGLDLTDAPIDALDARLKEYASTGASGAVRLIIEPAVDTPYQDVITVYDRCARAGFASVGLAKARAQ